MELWTMDLDDGIQFVYIFVLQVPINNLPDCSRPANPMETFLWVLHDHLLRNAGFNFYQLVDGDI